MDVDAPYARLEAKLGYSFRDVAQLESALTHKSYVNENPTWPHRDNERLEFLGDAVIDLVVGHLLMNQESDRSEGELSKRRAQSVSEAGLAELARELELGEWLFLGRGEEQSGGRRKPSVLADACEAVIAAVYLDGSFDAAFTCVQHLFEGRLAALHTSASGDWKTRLQERMARRHQPVRYVVVEERGPDHEKEFDVVVAIADVEYARATGHTKKEAEQRAAKAALERLDTE